MSVAERVKAIEHQARQSGTVTSGLGDRFGKIGEIVRLQ